MKKFLAVLILAAFAVTMFPITTAYASAQTVECSWWGKMIYGEYSKGRNTSSPTTITTTSPSATTKRLLI